MKTSYLFLFALVFAFACQEEAPPEPSVFPDFSSCNCSLSYDPVCGEDGNSYLNECLLTCMGKDSVSSGNCSSAQFKVEDTLTWPIELVCFPIPTPESPQFQRVLSDGTAIYKDQDDRYFRGTQNFCRCLPPHTRIATPEGEILVSELKKGDTVWTMSEEGERIARTILRMQTVPVGEEHIMLNLHLEDGRYLEVSSLHPNKMGFPLSSLQVGDSLDGVRITQMYWTHYSENQTWDLLPEGVTGVYWANGILIGSTMKPLSESCLP